MKSPDKLNMLAMFDDIPALKDIPGFRDIVDRVPDDLDFADLDDYWTAELETMHKEESNPDYWELKSPAPTAVKPVTAATTAPPCTASTCSKSRPTSIRIPNTILVELKAVARAKGIGYQTLIIRILKTSVSGS